MKDLCAVQNYPVIIVGGGPVGLILALFLDYYNVKCTLLNDGLAARIHPKGNSLNARTMEHFRQLGLSDEIRKLGLPGDHPFDQVYLTRFNSWELHRWPSPCTDERMRLREIAPANDQFREPMYHVNQMYVEQFLLEKVLAAPNVEVRFGWKVTGFAQNQDGVDINARNVENHVDAHWRGSYVVACDGGRSFFRQSLGIALVGDLQQNKDVWMAGVFNTIWLRIPELYPRCLGRRRGWHYFAVNPDSATRCTLIPLNGKDEFEMLLKSQSPSDQIDLEQLGHRIKEAIGEDMAVEVLACHPWNAGAALVAERYQDGRILLAGDAAHLFTPVGGFGMNTGIDDAHNLAWKLAAVLQGWGGQGLIDSYEQERKPVGHRNTGAARLYSSQWHHPEHPEEIEDVGPRGEEARRKAPELSFIANSHFKNPEELDCAGIQLGARYDGSKLIEPNGDFPPDSFPETYDRYIPSGIPGGRAPHVWLGEKRDAGSSLYDHLGKGFTLLRLNAKELDVGPLLSSAGAKGMLVTLLDVDVPEAKELYGCKLALIRPDRYIAWRGDIVPEDCGSLLARVSGS